MLCLCIVCALNSWGSEITNNHLFCFEPTQRFLIIFFFVRLLVVCVHYTHCRVVSCWLAQPETRAKSSNTIKRTAAKSDVCNFVSHVRFMSHRSRRDRDTLETKNRSKWTTVVHVGVGGGSHRLASMNNNKLFSLSRSCVHANSIRNAMASAFRSHVVFIRETWSQILPFGSLHKHINKRSGYSRACRGIYILPSQDYVINFAYSKGT